MFDPLDPYSQRKPTRVPEFLPDLFICRTRQNEWYGDTAAAKAWKRRSNVCNPGEPYFVVDFSPMYELSTCSMRKLGCERYAGVGAFIETHPDTVHPVVAKIIPREKIYGSDMCPDRISKSGTRSQDTQTISGYPLCSSPPYSFSYSPGSSE
jgi:hypothetical protein